MNLRGVTNETHLTGDQRWMIRNCYREIRAAGIERRAARHLVRDLVNVGAWASIGAHAP